ncbi:MAG TPA: hypothetical protein VOB72_04050 [Candidatus Dormibacteraeota bacterium]|nr:hypothetical protein [Candidatus Dormibacteraeota bacterium]
MDTSILTRRIGPLPGWAWGGLVAVGLWWFFVRGKSGAATASAGSSTAPNANSVYGLGYAQGIQAASAAPVSNQAPATSSLAQLLGAPPPGESAQGAVAWDNPMSGRYQVAVIPWGSSVQTTGQAQQGHANAQGVPQLWRQVTVGGQTGWLPANYFQTLPGGGVGGPGTARKHAAGSRSAHLMHDAHPLVGANVRYAHYVRAVGGPGNHRREIARVAHQAGVHPARVAMLNPVYTGRIRVA